MASVPAIAVAARHAAGLEAPPNSCMPQAMSHLPNGGCTTYSALGSQWSVSPAAKGMFGLTACPCQSIVSGQLRGSPVLSMVQASLT